MAERELAWVAIVDFGMGNLFSVQQACEQVGLTAVITASPQELEEADAAILPGVGAFGDAMEALNSLGLATALKSFVASDKPLVGICLGMQLLMEESLEFGRHRGLGVFEGQVRRLEPSPVAGKTLKVPQVGWNRIYPRQAGLQEGNGAGPHNLWEGTLLQGIAPGDFMYFVHSFYAQPEDAGLVLSTTTYGDTGFCSSLRRGNVFACQFHPERSGPSGLGVYRNLAALIGAGDSERAFA